MIGNEVIRSVQNSGQKSLTSEFSISPLKKQIKGKEPSHPKIQATTYGEMKKEQKKQANHKIKKTIKYKVGSPLMLLW